MDSALTKNPRWDWNATRLTSSSNLPSRRRVGPPCQQCQSPRPPSDVQCDRPIFASNGRPRSVLTTFLRPDSRNCLLLSWRNHDYGVLSGCTVVSVKLSESRRSVRALHLFKGAQTETVRLHFDASASFKSLHLTLMGCTVGTPDFAWRMSNTSINFEYRFEQDSRSVCCGSSDPHEIGTN